jgi:hypothetical protein
MRTLGDLDCGKHGVDDVPAFHYLLEAIETRSERELSFLLVTLDGAVGRSIDELDRELSTRFCRAEDPVMAEPSWVGDDGSKRYGFATSVPCYGINSFTRPREITATWTALRSALESWPEQRIRLLSTFKTEIDFYYGAHARRSAALSVMW